MDYIETFWLWKTTLFHEIESIADEPTNPQPVIHKAGREFYNTWHIRATVQFWNWKLDSKYIKLNVVYIRKFFLSV